MSALSLSDVRLNPDEIMASGEYPLTRRDLSQIASMIYADADRAGEIVIPEKELSLLRTLRNQAVLAIKQSS